MTSEETTDLAASIKNVIEATLLPIIQEQQEKIERLEKKLEIQQAKIEKLECLQEVQPRNSAKRSSMVVTSMNASQSQQQLQRADPSILKLQQKKLESEKKSATQEINKIKKEKEKEEDKKCQRTDQKRQSMTAKEALKKLPEPKNEQKVDKDIKKSGRPNTAKTPNYLNQKIDSPQKAINDKKNKQQQQKQQEKKEQEQQQQQQQQISQQNEDQFEQGEQDQQIKQINNQQLIDDENHEDDINLLDHEESYSFEVKFKAMAKELFSMIKDDFMGDFITFQSDDIAFKYILHIFLFIHHKDKLNVDDPNFWNAAKQQIIRLENQFSTYIENFKYKKFTLTDINYIRNYVEEHPVVINQPYYEDHDAVCCSLAYFIKDFYQFLQTLEY